MRGAAVRPSRIAGAAILHNGFQVRFYSAAMSLSASAAVLMTFGETRSVLSGGANGRTQMS
jgi:hypothetical protein